MSIVLKVAKLNFCFSTFVFLSIISIRNNTLHYTLDLSCFQDRFNGRNKSDSDSWMALNGSGTFTFTSLTTVRFHEQILQFFAFRKLEND